MRTLAIPMMLALLFSLACGKSGGGGDDPGELCDDYCERLSDCGWVLPGFGDPCNASLCADVVDLIEGDEDDCDDALVDLFECELEASCTELEFEPCQNLLDIAERECEGLL